jgi:hypothetical protein
MDKGALIAIIISVITLIMNQYNQSKKAAKADRSALQQELNDCKDEMERFVRDEITKRLAALENKKS